MKKTILKIITSTLLLSSLYTTAYAGAEVVVTLNTGDKYTWQFNDFEEASEFLADRVEAGRCSPKVANLEIRSVWIDGIDEPRDQFAYYHGIENQSIY